MDSKVENIVDLGLVNFVPHPSNPNYIVFRFADLQRANDFEVALKTKKIWFEKGEESTRKKEYTLFGIHKNDYSSVQSINFDVEANNRTFIINNSFFRWTLIIFSIGVVSLAFFGYCSHPELLNEDTAIEKVNE